MAEEPSNARQNRRPHGAANWHTIPTFSLLFFAIGHSLSHSGCPPEHARRNRVALQYGHACGCPELRAGRQGDERAQPNGHGAALLESVERERARRGEEVMALLGLDGQSPHRVRICASGPRHTESLQLSNRGG